MRAASVLLLLALVVAGCVAPTPDVGLQSDTVGTPFVDPLVDEHDHADPTIHKHAWNVEQVWHDPLSGSSTRSAFSHVLDVKAGHLFVGTWGEEADTQGGVWIFDVADPAAPTLKGRVRIPGMLNGDRSMEATQDGQFVVLGTEPLSSFGQVNPFLPGLYLIDARDKSAPNIAHVIPSRGIHSVTIHTIGGKDIVFISATPDMRTIYEIVKSPRPLLVPIGSLPIGHDAVVHDDELEGKPILYAANGFAGFDFFDVSTPAEPKKLASWNIPDRNCNPQGTNPECAFYVHTGAMKIIDGRRIVVVSSEDWKDYPSTLWVLDATDWNGIELLSNWSNPGGHSAKDIRFSLHNPRFLGNDLVIAHYHAGAWALDLSTPEARAAPPVLGVFVPGEDVGRPYAPVAHPVMKARGRGFAVDSSPLVFDVETHEGLVYVADMQTGVYAVKPLWR